MPKKTDRSPVTFWNWFFTVLLMGIPCLGFFYMLAGAFAASNESKRNFFRAQLAWLLLILVFYSSLALVGTVPGYRQLLQSYRKAWTQSIGSHTAKPNKGSSDMGSE